MPRVIRIDKDEDIGTISDAHQAFLVAQLEDANSDDTDYDIDAETIELLSDNDGDPELLAMLEKGLGDDDSMTIAFEA